MFVAIPMIHFTKAQRIRNKRLRNETMQAFCLPSIVFPQMDIEVAVPSDAGEFHMARAHLQNRACRSDGIEACVAINREPVNSARLGLHRVTSGVMRLGVFSVGAALILLLSQSSRASADHLIYLPLAGQTWMAQQIKNTQEQVWCADARSSSYPQFLAQVRAVNDQYTARVGIKHRQVDFNDPACQIKHTMPDNHGCSGCAAWIFYANKPVVIEYKYQLGFVSWESTIGHELGHGILGQLHERYIDSGGTIQCGGPEVGLSVMDCGPPYVRYPTTGLDVPRGCAIILTNWCGQAPSVTWPQWTGTRWLFEDGWSFAPNSGCGEWFLPDGRLAWGPCAEWGGRWNALVQVWTMPSSTYHPASNTWWAGGLSLP